jgi:hypothetical protein
MLRMDDTSLKLNRSKKLVIAALTSQAIQRFLALFRDSLVNKVGI